MVMTPWKMSYSLGRIRASQTDYLYTPNPIRGAGKFGVMALHGATAPDEFAKADRNQSVRIAQNTAFAGIPLVGGQMSSDSFANPNSQTDMTNALPVLALAGCSTTKVHLLGVSMGCLLAIQWAGANPSKVASIQGIIPATSIQRLYETNAGALSASIASAWAVTAPRVVTDGVTNGTTTYTSATMAFVPGDTGKILQGTNIVAGTTVTYVNATTVTLSVAATGSGTGQTQRLLTLLPAGADLTAEYATILSNNIPVRLHYTSSDPTITSAGVIADGAAMGATVVDLGGAAGHSETTVGLFDKLGAGDSSDYIAFIEANGA